MRTSRTTFVLLLTAAAVMAWLINSVLNDNNALPPESAISLEPSTALAPQSTIFPKPSASPAEADATQKPQIIPPEMALHGTLINDDVRRALVSIDNGPQRWLNNKEYVNADFYLDEIYKDYVVIRDTGKTTSLEIRITTDGGSTEGLPEAAIPAVPAHAWLESLPAVPGIDQVQSNHYRIKRDLIIKELNSGEIFKQVKIVPNEKDGFFIERIKEGSMAEIIGLRVGDSIHKINNKPLTNITDILDLYKNIESLEKVEVEINRMNQVQQLHYELD